VARQRADREWQGSARGERGQAVRGASAGMQRVRQTRKGSARRGRGGGGRKRVRRGGGEEEEEEGGRRRGRRR
jgi:hypothetical protein